MGVVLKESGPAEKKLEIITQQRSFLFLKKTKTKTFSLLWQAGLGDFEKITLMCILYLIKMQNPRGRDNEDAGTVGAACELLYSKKKKACEELLCRRMGHL